MRKWLLIPLVFLCSYAFSQKAGQKDSTTTTQVIQPSPATPSRQVWIKGWLRADSAWVNVAIPFGTLKDTLDAFRTRIGTGGSGSTDLSGVRDTIADIIIDVGDLQTGAIPFSGTNGNALEFSADTIRNMVVISPLQKDAGGLRILNQMSVDYDGFGLKLKGDQQSPVALKFYSTDTSAVKGWFTLDAWWNAARTLTQLWSGLQYFQPGISVGDQSVSKNGQVIFASYIDGDAAWVVMADSTPVEGAIVKMKLPPKATGMYYFATTSDTSTFLTYVKSLLDLKAPLASPTFTGTPIFTLTSDAAGDIWYRAVTTGYMTRLALGSAGQRLAVGTNAPAWIASDTVGLGTSLDGKQDKASFDDSLYSHMAGRLVYTCKITYADVEAAPTATGISNKTGTTATWSYDDPQWKLTFGAAISDNAAKVKAHIVQGGVSTPLVWNVETSTTEVQVAPFVLAGTISLADVTNASFQVWVDP